MLIAIDDPADARIAPFMNVRDRDLAGSHGGYFIAEGESVLNVFLAQTRYERVAMLVAANRADAAERIAAGVGLPIYVAEQPVMDAIVGFPIHRGLLGLGRRGVAMDARDILEPNPGLVVGMVGIANHDNMGGIFRNAAAFDVGAVLVDQRSCDPFYRKALRVSVGGVMKVPFAQVAAGTDMVALLKARGYRVLALSPQGDRPLAEIDRSERMALMLGSEGPGLPDAVMAQAETVRIDMPGVFDSLNVATTSGIALYELTRPR